MKTIAETTSHEKRTLQALLSGIAMALLLVGAARAEYGYSYFRTVDGSASLQSADDGEWLEALENHPLIAGDYLEVGSSSRIEVVLADGGLLRVAGGSEVSFDSLAWTQDTDATVTRLYLSRGAVQVVLGEDVEGYEPLEIETQEATLYFRAPGAYRLESLDGGGLELIVRDGFAEARTDEGLTIVRSGEMAYLDRWGGAELTAAPGPDSLERWGEDLNAEARLADVPYVEPQLRYRAARMATHGNWVDISGRWGWRPYVSVGWRPYMAGSWVYTPSGITWVSSEPWGWIPSHYGSWDLVAGVGWVWFAGGHYSPANVYWYWGPTHVAWVPAGYYTSYYGGYGHGPRFGVYGWAGGNWGFFSEWVFCPTRYFGRSRYDLYFRTGRDVARHVTYREVPRGIIATDTRTLRRDVWGEPDRITARLTAADSRLSRERDLPDVTRFVARERDLRPELAEMARSRDLTETAPRGRPAIDAARDVGSARVTTARPSGGGYARDDDAKTYARPAPSTTRPTPRFDSPSEARPGARPAPRVESERPGYGRPSSVRPSYERPESTRPDAGSFDRDAGGSVYSRPAPGSTRPAPRSEPRTDSDSRVYGRVYERPSGAPVGGSGSGTERPAPRPNSSGSTAVRPPTSSIAPPAAGSGATAGRPVVQKVIEQLRSTRGTSSPPPSYSRPPAPAPRSTPRASAPSPQRPPQSSRGSVRGSSGSSSRGSSGASSARQRGSSRSSSRKPPG